MSEQALLTFAGLFVNVVVLSVLGTWALARTAAAINKTITENRQAVDDEINRVRRETGETAAAIRAKIVEVELWGRDNFVKRDLFSAAMERMETNVTNMGDRIEARLLRMEGKLDKSAAQST